MPKQRTIPSAIKASLLGLIGVGLMTVVDTQPSLAGNCGGHCQAGKMCGSLVSQKGVKGAEKRTEYQKCMADPQNYK